MGLVVGLPYIEQNASQGSTQVVRPAFASRFGGRQAGSRAVGQSRGVSRRCDSGKPLTSQFGRRVDGTEPGSSGLSMRWETSFCLIDRGCRLGLSLKTFSNPFVESPFGATNLSVAFRLQIECGMLRELTNIANRNDRRVSVFW